MNIKYEDVVKVHGNGADQAAELICKIHGGLGFQDFKSHSGGIDTSGCSEADQEKIKDLLAPKESKKEEKAGK